MSDQGLGEASGQEARPQPGTSVPHTPGPWELSRTGVRRDGYSDVSGGAWSGLAEVVTRMAGDAHDYATGVANGRLIAAAPELLTALIELKEATNERALRGSKHVPAMRRQQDAMTAARAAIAKATSPSASIGGE